MAYTTINKSTDYFNTKLWSGNGNDNTSITGVGFQPDLSWVKARDKVENNLFTDAVRGGNKQIYSNLTSAETSDGNKLKSFNADGFTIGTSDVVNNSISNYVAWNWLASNTSGSANTDGSISSTVSANTTSGFSIVSYSGSNSNSTVGHGLGVAPKVIIIKRRNVADNWRVLHMSAGNDNTAHLNLTSGFSSSAVFQNTSPTSTVFSLVGNNTSVNQSGSTYIAYCFAEVPGYSKFGSYTGNGADGSSTENFIYTGFKPTWVMVKRSNDSGQQWTICDTTRSPSNVSGSMEWLFADNSGIETDEDLPYMLSNGFMPRTGHTYMNRNGFSYVYMAFGQSLVGSNNIPATAR